MHVLILVLVTVLRHCLKSKGPLTLAICTGKDALPFDLKKAAITDASKRIRVSILW